MQPKPKQSVKNCRTKKQSVLVCDKEEGEKISRLGWWILMTHRNDDLPSPVVAYGTN